jgi:hypothetical protein
MNCWDWSGCCRTLPPVSHIEYRHQSLGICSAETFEGATKHAGIRGEVLKLRWVSLSFNRRLRTVEGRKAVQRYLM